MVRRTIYRCGAGLVALGLFASACSSGGDENGDGSGEGEPAPGRSTLEIAVGSISGWSPMIPHENQALGELQEALNIPLFQIDDQNQVYSNMLESWETSEDASTVTLNMRQDLEWSDGEPITSDDVMMSLTQYLDPDLSVWASRIGGVAGQDAFAEGEADSISGLTAPDEYTVVVELEEPDAAWAPLLGFLGKFVPVLPEHVLGDVPHDEIKEHEYFETYSVTSGPFTLADYVSDQYVELERNPNWSYGEAGFERIFFKVVDPNVQSAQMESGEVQLIPDVEPTDADRLGAIEGVDLQSTTGAAPTLWSVMYAEPLLDPRVRQAMLYAIDRQGICEQALSGYCTVQTANLWQIGPEWALPTEDLIEYNYDPDRARELLDEAGWDPDTELTFFNLSPGGVMDTVVEIAVANMAEVGINWTVVNTDAAATFESVEQNGADELQGFNIAGGNFTVDPSQVQPYTECDTHYPAGSNFWLHCDPEMDELWEAGRQTADQSERAEIYHEIFRSLNQDPYGLQLFVQDAILAHDSRLKGVKVHPSKGYLWNVGEWTWEE